MRNRILEFSQAPARLRVAHRQLVIQQTDSPDRSIPIEDIAVLIAAHPQVSYTQAVLTELISSGGTFVTCNSARMPIGMVLPLDAHSTQTQRFREQFETPVPRKKRLWQQVVRSKIRMQATVLCERTGEDHGLRALEGQVRSGDVGNVEAWAAKKYWTALFGNRFRRDRDADDVNAILNYGYAVLRASTARAICAAGLHPSIGIHHRNKYNSWCLADDLMEPYRPMVDRIAAQLLDEGTLGDAELSTEVRARILRGFTGKVHVETETRSLFDALALSSQSLAACLLRGESGNLVFPEEFIDAAS